MGKHFLGESQSSNYPIVCQIWLRSDGHVKKAGTDRQTDRQTDSQPDRQTDKGTLQLYIVDCLHAAYRISFI